MMYRLDEASLNRAYQHVVEKKSKSWGMITAFRQANTHEENMRMNHELGQDLRKMGLGFFKVEGHWQECQNSKLPYTKCPKDQLVDATENSFFAPNITKKQITALCKKYEQDAVVYGGEDTKGDAYLIYKDGSDENVGKFRADKVEQAYSRLKGGHTFAFNKDDTKLKNMIPSDTKIKNPETGRMIKVKTALGYSEEKPVYQAAVKMVKKA